MLPAHRGRKQAPLPHFSVPANPAPPPRVSPPIPENGRRKASAARSDLPAHGKPSRGGGGVTPHVLADRVRPERRRALAIRWLVGAARARGENTMTEKLAGELLDASNNRGAAVKKREDTHKMAEANRAFSHYRW